MTPTKKTKYTKVNSAGEVEEHDLPFKKKGRKGLKLPKQYLDLGLYLAMPLLMGVFVGQLLDRKFNTKAIFTISLLIFGTITVFYNLYKLYREDDSHTDRNSK